MEHSRALRLPAEPSKDTSLAAPLANSPIAAREFRRSMTALVLLSVPLWALIGTIGYLAVRAFG